MKETRPYFTQDSLLYRVRTRLIASLRVNKTAEIANATFSNIDCIMSALAVFTFKFPSLLRFDKARTSDKPFLKNLRTLFHIKGVPCDTYMRERLDEIIPHVIRPAYTALFTLLQRCKLLEQFRFFKDYYLISLDGTGIFSSHTIHCKQCCTKEHRDGTVTYHHQIVAAALVHPDQKVAYPLCPEPIMKSDGMKKNDCERNAVKRWVADFRREHPHLKTIILADGLSSNEPFITILTDQKLSYILVCKEGDHAYLSDWLNHADAQDKPEFTETINGVTSTYSYMRDVPLNESKDSCRITVVSLTETKKGKTTKWMWVTDLIVDLTNIKEFTKGGRARWKVENETFNTLKNQGYEFEHNFGHGKKYLHTVLAHLMMLAFFIDQCLQHVNKRFQEAYTKRGSKKALWENMLFCLYTFEIPDFESIYHFIVHPPPLLMPSILK
jgi:hypothetical protein